MRRHPALMPRTSFQAVDTSDTVCSSTPARNPRETRACGDGGVTRVRVTCTLRVVAAMTDGAGRPTVLLFVPPSRQGLTMRAPQLLSDFFEWRWAPCVGLTAGSLAFVALAMLVIPTRAPGAPRVMSTLSSFDSPRPQRALYASSLSPSLAEPEERGASGERPLPKAGPQNNASSAPLRRGFSPIVDRPEPPPPPPPPPPQSAAPAQASAQLAVELPAPVPGSVVVAQPVPSGESREVTVQ
jgi:hypothetical protein